MLWWLIKYMPYLVQRLWQRLIVIFHHCLHTGTQVTPHSLHRSTTDKYFLMTLCNDSTKQVAEGTQAAGGVVWSSGLQVCRYGHWSGLQLSLGPWANPSHCKKPLPAPMAEAHALTALPLLGPSSKLTHRPPYPCELSPGLQASSKQVSQVQGGAHEAALDDKFSLPFPTVNGKRGPWTRRATAPPRSPHLSSSALLPLLLDGYEVPSGAVPQPPLPSKTDWTMATGSTGGSEQAQQPGRGTWGLAVAFTPGLTGSSLISMRHFPVSETRLSTTHTSVPQRPCATEKVNSTRACFHFPSNCPMVSFHSPRWVKETSNLSPSSRNTLSWNTFGNFIIQSYTEFAPFRCL